MRGRRQRREGGVFWAESGGRPTAPPIAPRATSTSRTTRATRTAAARRSYPSPPPLQPLPPRPTHAQSSARTHARVRSPAPWWPSRTPAGLVSPPVMPRRPRRAPGPARLRLLRLPPQRRARARPRVHTQRHAHTRTPVQTSTSRERDSCSPWCCRTTKVAFWCARSGR